MYLLVIVTLLLSACGAAPAPAGSSAAAGSTSMATVQAASTAQTTGQGQPADVPPAPPQEAYAACVSKTEQATCEFTSQRGAETGVCEMVQSQLACSPQHGQNSGAPGNSASAASSASATSTSSETPVGVIMPTSSDGTFKLSSTEVTEGGALPIEFTCDGANATLPLTWSGAPAGTQSYAVIMNYIPTGEESHWYWILYGIPATVTSLAKNSTEIGVLGTNSQDGKVAYAPPCSKGPGPKIYTYTVYALSAEPTISVAADQVNRETLLAAIQDITLASAALNVIYTR